MRKEKSFPSVPFRLYKNPLLPFRWFSYKILFRSDFLKINLIPFRSCRFHAVPFFSFYDLSPFRSVFIKFGSGPFFSGQRLFRSELISNFLFPFRSEISNWKICLFRKDCVVFRSELLNQNTVPFVISKKKVPFHWTERKSHVPMPLVPSRSVWFKISRPLRQSCFRIIL